MSNSTTAKLVATTARARRAAWLTTTLVRSGLVAPLRPDKYLSMAKAVKREGFTATSGIALAACRRPAGLAIVDELGGLTWGELDARCNALAAAWSRLESGPQTVAILARNHRGFVEALAAAGRLGADVLLLNTGFAGPQLAEVVAREGVDILVYDEEFFALVEPLVDAGALGAVYRAWCDGPPGPDAIEALIEENLGSVPVPPDRVGRVVLLTSGTTGTPKGARRSAGGGVDLLAALLDRIPWRAEEPVVVAAPMFHAWGFGQLCIAATMACTIVTSRRFDPEQTVALVDRYQARGLSVVPVMLERIMDLDAEVRERYSLASLRFVTASGSRMKPESVTAFMDEYGEVIYNSYNATEVGMITTAVPEDLRVAPETAGKAMPGTDLRVFDSEGGELSTGEVGEIYVRNGSQFDGYTSGGTKSMRNGYMASGDLGRLDEAGRLFVVGRVDQMIVSGGENVYPVEVESLLTACRGVREAAVVGVDDSDFGQRLVAYVVLQAEADLSLRALRDLDKEQLAGYKVPREIIQLAELPRNATGKVAPRELADAPVLATTATAS